MKQLLICLILVFISGCGAEKVATNPPHVHKWIYVGEKSLPPPGIKTVHVLRCRECLTEISTEPARH